ncbi:MAG TPA: recombination protein RecR [Rhodospirillaceae bacterium]|nr:recombination protein RecR [Rhodospirillaceae bacterium]
MMSPLDRLTQLLAKLPGLGPRSARRVVLHLLQRRESLLMPLVSALSETASAMRSCPVCGNWDVVSPCLLCQDERRDQTLLCVVEDVADLWALERSRAFKGYYHVLGGTLSALDGIQPADLRIESLLVRVGEGHVREVILALSATLEGQTTAHYVQERLEKSDVQVSKLAHGLPIGGELDYLDEGTITAALTARR